MRPRSSKALEASVLSEVGRQNLHRNRPQTRAWASAIEYAGNVRLVGDHGYDQTDIIRPHLCPQHWVRISIIQAPVIHFPLSIHLSPLLPLAVQARKTSR